MKRNAKKVADIKTKYGTFRCVFEPERDMGGYVVTAPAVQGAISWGKTLADAKLYAVEAIECSVEGEIIMAAVQSGQVAFRKQKVPAFA